VAVTLKIDNEKAEAVGAAITKAAEAAPPRRVTRAMETARNPGVATAGQNCHIAEEHSWLRRQSFWNRLHAPTSSAS
jgi:hypothetical protein